MMNEQGGKTVISNFAPRMGFDAAALPFPKNAKAQAFGVRADRVPASISRRLTH